MCGPSQGSKTAANQIAQTSAAQSQQYQQAVQQAQSIFGSSSNVFNQLMSSFSPVLAAGPGQEGYTPGQLANLNSQAITQTGQQYRNAAQAAGERSAASGGGNALLPSGVTSANQAAIASQGAGTTANQLAQIRNDSANLGRQNWLSAAQVLGNAPGVFSPATSALGASTSAGNSAISGGQASFDAQNQLSQQSNWWQPLVGQVLGAGLSMATGGLSGLATQGLGSFTGGSVGGHSDSSLGSPQYMPGGGGGISMIAPQGSGGFGTVPGS